MICKKCGSTMADDARFCTVCGSRIEVEAPVAEPAYYEETAPLVAETPVAEAPKAPTYTPPVYTAPTAQPAPSQSKIPEQYQPLSPWAYWGYTLLFSVPIVGFIFLIVFSCKNSNINRRNYARSYWCNLIILGIALVIFLLIALIGGAGIMTAVRY